MPLPIGVAQLVLAWLAAGNVRPPAGLIAAVLLSAFCLISLLAGLFDGDLTNTIASVVSSQGKSPGENSQSGPAVSGVVVTTNHVRRLAVAAYLARFKG